MFTAAHCAGPWFLALQPLTCRFRCRCFGKIRTFPVPCAAVRFCEVAVSVGSRLGTARFEVWSALHEVCDLWRGTRPEASSPKEDEAVTGQAAAA